MAKYTIHLPISKDTYDRAANIDFGICFLIICTSMAALTVSSMIGAMIGASIMLIFNMSPLIDIGEYGLVIVISQPILLSIIITNFIVMIGLLIFFDIIEITHAKKQEILCNTKKVD